MPVKHQIINDDKGNPLFAVIPYKEYMNFRHYNDNIKVPSVIVESIIIKGYSLIKAWRSYKKLSQSEVANKMGISQEAFSQMEQPNANLSKDTIKKIEEALGVNFKKACNI